jgi:SNF2 family DNA or RNA helicase
LKNKNNLWGILSFKMIEIDDEIIYPTFTPKCKYEPLAHQLEALKFMRERERDSCINGGILALSMGLGKTFTSLYHAMMSGEEPKQTLIVAPKTALYTWVEEIRKFYGNTLSYFIFRKDENRVQNITREQLSRYNIILTNYEYVRTLATERNVYNKVALKDFNNRVFGANAPEYPVLKDNKGEGLLFSTKWPRIIADESHNFANYKTSLWRSVISLCGESKFCLSGTPIKNGGEDLYAQYKFLGYYEPEFDVKSFHKLNLSTYIYHADYNKAGIVLPKANHYRVNCPLENEQADIYDMFLKRANMEYNNFTIGGASFAAVFTLFLRLRQICLAPYTIVPRDKDVDTKEYREAQEYLDEMTGGLASWVNDKEGTAGLKSSKIEKITEIVKDIRKGEKVVIFTMFKRVIDLLAEKFSNTEGFDKKVICIDGTVTGKKRDDSITAFKNSNFDVLIVSYKIGAESLNLTEARHVILCESWWNSAVIEQAKGRIYRIGQEKEINIYEMMVPSDDRIKSIEVAMTEICDRKKMIANEYLTKGCCETTANLNARTMGEILRSAKNKE